ncbi:hypothetical protein ACS126_06165 [Sphingobacterium lactis]|uniref:hypothetical protein n=1 Tax=Sphingobacterium TaxID=28453 RepID=UPI00257A355A|nr:MULTISPECIES: hypothetical protein [Sphingobacterium]
MAKEKKDTKKVQEVSLKTWAAELLDGTFSDIKASVGKKKFKRKVKKASKILTSGVKKSAIKPKAEKVAKKEKVKAD